MTTSKQMALEAGPYADRVIAAAKATFGDEEKAYRWLGRPTTALDGAPPISLAGTEKGACRVEDLLARIGHGLSV